MINNDLVKFYLKSSEFAFIELDRADRRNALDREVLRQMLAAIDALPDTVRGLVIDTAARDMFSAGLDLADMPVPCPVDVRGHAPADDLLQAVCQRLERLAIPVAAVIRGPAIGGGCELALACDYRLASDRAWFRMPPLVHGYVYRPDGLWRYERALGRTGLQRLFLGGETWDAGEAQRQGLVHACSPHDAIDGALDDLLARLAQLDANAVAGFKSALLWLDEPERPYESDHFNNYLSARRQGFAADGRMLEVAEAFRARRQRD